MIIYNDEVRESLNTLKRKVYDLSIMYLFDGKQVVQDGEKILLLQKMCKGDDFMITLRDGISYKLKCIYLHLDFLKQIGDGHNKKLANTKDSIKQTQLFYRCVEEHMFLVEDIIFHLISLFDYLGNLIGYLYYGDSKRKIKWKGIMTCCRKPEWERKETGSEKIYKSSASEYLIDINDKIISKLQEYRAELIHYKYDLPSGKMSINIFEHDFSQFSVYTPKELLKIICAIDNEIKKDDKVKIYDALSILLKSISLKTCKIVDYLTSDLQKTIKLIR